MRFMAADVANATGGKVVGQNAHLDGVSFDSRTLRPGQLFVPIVAERDGHEFIDDAVARGAGAYLTAREPQGRRTAIVVADTLAALMDLGKFGRARLDPTTNGRVVGITGSVGKTSTKDFAHAVLSASLRTASSDKSFNNDQGLPTTILNAPDDTEALVVEMGMRGFGEIARLCSIARPHIGVVTAVAAAHTERVGGLDGVAKAKGELVEALPSSGTAILNADDARVVQMASRTSASVLTYGASATADVAMTSHTVDDAGYVTMSVASPWGSVDVRVPAPGAHMASNALAALAIAGVCGVSMDDAARGLESAQLSPMRMETHVTVHGATVVADCYNANPASVAAALHTLAKMRAARRVAILGVMAELADAKIEHERIAALARELGVEVFAVGTDLYGAPVIEIEAAVRMLDELGADAVALVKGSRVARLERVVSALRLR
ncbi:MAG: UDP-N-acetylmuramoyl-tripeptide-D-alanyl-D-alanine ligase MurF [Actinomycetota bacterium]